MWAIANAAFMAAMGPQGFAELGSNLLQRSHYAAARLASVPGVSVRFPEKVLKEVVVDFTETGRLVAEINAALRERQIFGGLDLSHSSPSSVRAPFTASRSSTPRTTSTAWPAPSAR